MTSYRQCEMTQRRSSRKPTEGKGCKGPDSRRAKQHGHRQRSDTDPRGPQQALRERFCRRASPRKNGRNRHDREHRQTDRNRQAIEERLTDDERSVLHCLYDEREHRAEQDDEGEEAEQQVVGEECTFTRDRRFDRAGCVQHVAAPTDEGDRHDDDQCEEGEQPRTDRAFREGVHAVQHTGAREERAEDGETERGDEERQVPYAQHSPALLHEYRVDVGGRGDPRHERGVFHRVPRPHAAPPEHLVAPPAPEDDSEREEAEGEQRPPSRGEQPALTETTSHERGDRERKRHGHADVPEVQKRRVEHHEDVVL